MILIDEVHRLDLASLIDWVVFKQGVEGGFQGRTNKLVDGCYSIWQGAVAVAVMMQRLDSVTSDQLGLSNVLDPDCELSDLSDAEDHVEETLSPVKGTRSPRQGLTTLSELGYKFISRKGASRPIFSSMHLQNYLLLCSQ